VDFWHRLVRVELVAPYFHMVSDGEVAHVSGLYKFRTVRQFKSDMEFFLKFYSPISLQDVIDHLEGIRRLPKRCFLPTFDDGFREIADVVAPILQAQGIPAAFFLTTSVVDNRGLCCSAKQSLLIRALSSLADSPALGQASQILTNAGVTGVDLPARIRKVSYRQRHVLDALAPILGCDFAEYAASVEPYVTSGQVRALMKQGFAIGAHSVDHPLYSELSLEEQLIQTRESVRWLSDRFQYECQAFAFPYTDNGVSLGFFRNAFGDGRLKVSFGTAGLRRHLFPRNLERFTMEKTDRRAVETLAREFGINVLSRVSGGNEPPGRRTELPSAVT